MTLLEIQTAVLAGKRVYWKNPGYQVVHTRILKPFPTMPVDQWLINCGSNNHCIGLTWSDGVTMNGKPEDFHIEETAP